MRCSANVGGQIELLSRAACRGRLLEVAVQFAPGLRSGYLLRRSSDKDQMHHVRLAWLRGAASRLDRSRRGDGLNVAELALHRFSSSGPGSSAGVYTLADALESSVVVKNQWDLDSLPIVREQGKPFGEARRVDGGGGYHLHDNHELGTYCRRAGADDPFSGPHPRCFSVS